IYDVSAAPPKQVVRLQDTTSVRALTWFAKDTMLATASDGGVIRVWDWNAGKPKERLPRRGHTGRVSSLAFAADGLTLASGSHDATVRLWTLNGPEPINQWTLTAKGAAVSSIALSPNGKRLAAGCTYDVMWRLWDVPAPAPRVWSYTKEPQGGAGAVAFVDNRTLLTGSREGKQGMLRLWD